MITSFRNLGSFSFKSRILRAVSKVSSSSAFSMTYAGLPVLSVIARASRRVDPIPSSHIWSASTVSLSGFKTVVINDVRLVAGTPPA